jgi:light-regulated signal transduction histidine kinase (bacteriophytochrome)
LKGVMTIKTNNQVYQFRINLKKTNPMIWRHFLIQDDRTLADLHYVIQIIMGWTDYVTPRQIGWKGPEHLPEIMADRVAILRVFRNFVDNALKYGGEDLSEIVIGYKEEDEHHIVYVSDNGIGLTEEESQNIFGLFERQKTAGGIMGSGLGLAIMKEIAEQHGGKVWSETGSNKGITFNISISKQL